MAAKLAAEQATRREQVMTKDLQEQLNGTQQLLAHQLSTKDQEIRKVSNQALDMGAMVTQCRQTITQLEQKVACLAI